MPMALDWMACCCNRLLLTFEAVSRKLLVCSIGLVGFISGA
jgi:hypothetical protein